MTVDDPQSDCEPARLAPAQGPTDAARGPMTNVVQWGWYSVLVNVVLLGLHALIASASGSLAVTAEAIHNAVDLATAVVLVLGLKLAARQAKAFPYGLYKVENIVAAGLAIMIFVTAYEVSGSVFLGTARSLHVDAWMLASMVATMAIPLVFSHFELKVARATNSPALLADAREYRVHVYTTGLAFAALLAARFEFPFDRIAALIIVVAVARTGWELLVDAVRVLLDASLDPRTLGEIREVIEADPSIAEVKWLTGRSAGRYRFVEAGVTLRLADLARAELALRRIEAAVRVAIPQVERVLLHVEASASSDIRYAVPLADLAGVISEHLGEAPYFAFVTVDRADGSVREQHVRANPYRDVDRAKGIRVAEWLTGMKVDSVYLSRDLEGKGPAYVFREAGVDVRRTDAGTIHELVSTHVEDVNG